MLFYVKPTFRGQPTHEEREIFAESYSEEMATSKSDMSEGNYRLYVFPPNALIPNHNNPDESISRIFDFPNFFLLPTQVQPLSKGVSRSQTKGSWYYPFPIGITVIREIAGSGLYHSGNRRSVTKFS